MQHFVDWYEQRHGYEPFPWQVRLAELVAAGTPPPSIAVPTGAGKTAIIAVWHWATGQGLPVPTRLIYVVDRRLIVDSVTAYAERLGCQVVKMRGGVTIDSSWMMAPNRPTVIVSTVDQAGSRLLWRGFGVSPATAPIHAALIGNDALLVLDEAHISTPFAATLAAVQELRRKESLPWHVVTMTATPLDGGDTLELAEADRSHPVLRRRLHSRKPARLVKVEKAGFVAAMVAEANKLRDQSAGVVGVIANTTGRAREIFQRLAGDKVLLTGRIRPVDRDSILSEFLPRMISGSRAGRQPLFVVATQTIEVGADLDFDALVTQNAPVDALRQRFGRLDRLGELGDCQAVIVHEELGTGDECRVYGKTLLNRTWTWLKKAQTGKGRDKRVDFGITAMAATLAQTPPPLREAKVTRPFTADDLWDLRQTHPRVEVDITPWLHGDNSDETSVTVVWREDLFADTGQWAATVSAAPPVLAEAMPCPVYEVRGWLGQRPALVGEQVVPGRNIRPGDLVVVPASYGGYGPWGWEPGSRQPVEDVGNRAGARVRLIGADETSDIHACLAALGLTIDRSVATPYPAGLVVTAANRRVNSRAVGLEDHLAAVEGVAREWTDNPLVWQAARAHDRGKTDPRFQVLLGARDHLLAKSGHTSPWAARQARSWSGLPEGWRHEVASTVLLPTGSPALLRYLVATHHGLGRAVLPVGGDYPLWLQAGGPRWGNMTEQLNADLGAWGLAYLEALVRLADWVQSEREQRDGL